MELPTKISIYQWYKLLLRMIAFVKWKEKKYQLLALRWMRFR